MKLSDVHEAYYGASGTASGIVRNLALAGIALVWVLREEAKTKVVPGALVVPALLIVAALLLDLLQYAVSTATWGLYGLCKENQGVTAEKEFLAPRAINWAPLILFWAKLTTMIVGYVLLLRYLLVKYV